MTLLQKFLFLILVYTGILLVSSCSFDQLSNESHEDTKTEMVVRHPRVLWTESPSNHAIISWTSSKQGNKHYVEYKAIAGNRAPEVYSMNVNSSKDGRITFTKDDEVVDVPPGYFHHAELKGLHPNTRYYFRVCSDNHCSDSYYFITAPETGTTFSFVAGGDSRMGGENLTYGGKTPHVERQMMNELISTLVEKDPSIMAFAHGGDFCSNAYWRHLYWWFDDHMMTYTDDNRILPLIVARGNHDMEIGFVENFWLGDISTRNSDAYYYTTRMTNDIALVTLNTEISITGDQRKWLDQQLELLRPAHRWLFVQYHRPAWPAVKYFNSEDFTRIRNHWVPLFEKHNIDLAIESDGHALKRTVPIRNGAKSEDGIIYIGEGGLGVPQRTPDPHRWFLKNGGMTRSIHHIWKVDIREDQTHLTAIGMNKDTLEHYKIYPRR